jgi:hypothetical protein
MSTSVTIEPPNSTTPGNYRRMISHIVDRLALDARERVPRPMIAELVLAVADRLPEIAPDAFPELLERLSRAQLTYYYDEPSAWLN